LFNASRLFLDAVVEVRQSLLQVAGVSKEIVRWGEHGNAMDVFMGTSFI